MSSNEIQLGAMNKRSYNQYCPLAYSLDVIGERWTLLIVRELLYGPRRYTDILNGLPGMGSNLLAKRLKDLERASIVTQRHLPPPAGSTVYELTERGRGLEEVVMLLANWGLDYLQMPPPEPDFLGPVPSMGAFDLLFDPLSATGVNITCEVRAGRDVFQLIVADGGLTVMPGPVQKADVVVETDLKILFQHLLHDGEPSANGQFSIVTGDTATFERFATAFRLPQS